ncbi:uncharacterized protein LOC115224896 [Octopus sinensis]|uniref:Uncharacterized protein LOC115224896 n=1 Tax=Octopus sinensis TaxID=2607531 RepID=A0A6P7TJV4_9MOLL|nr:uncharacterized protein LOC115224896 [Octopus sinensis]
MLKEHLYGWYPAVNGDSNMSTYLTECLYRNQRPKSCRPFNSGIPTIGGIIRQKTALQTELEMTPKEFLSRCKSAPGSSRSSSKPFVFQRQSTFHRSQCREYRVPDQPKRPSTCHVVSSVQNKHLFNKTRSPKRSEGLVLTNEQLNQSRKTPHNDVDFSSADHRISQNDSPGNSLTEAISKERCDDEKNRISVLNYEEGQEITLTCKKVRSLALKEAELYNPDSYRQNLRKNGWLMQVEGNIFGLKQLPVRLPYWVPVEVRNTRTDPPVIHVKDSRPFFYNTIPSQPKTVSIAAHWNSETICRKHRESVLRSK